MKRLLLVFAFAFLALEVSAERFIPKSDLIPKVLLKIQDSYVDQQRVRPYPMLEGALERLSAMIIPVMTDLEKKGDKIKIKVSVDKSSKTFEYKEPKTIYDLNQILQEVATFTKQNLDREEKPENVDYALINGFLSKLDPHTMLLVPEVYTEFSANTEGNFGGVGMMIGIREGDLTIISPINGTPAFRAGLKPKDRIVQIDEESTINMPLNEAVSKLRGQVGTKVMVYILRTGMTAPKAVTLIRDEIKINSVESYAFKKNGKRVGYIQLKGFQKNSIDELNEHLMEMDYDLNDFQGLILDLRNNPGGLLDQAIRISNRFLDRGVIVSTAGLDPGSIQSARADWYDTIKDVPIIVLINNGSASASEIVAAALKSNGRAVVIGDQSFGKGSVQEVVPYPDGSALKFTKSKYLTPGEKSIQSVGVTPHIKVLPQFVETDFVRLTPPKPDQLEKSLDQNFEEWGDRPEDTERTAFYLDSTTDMDIDELESLPTEERMQKRLEVDYLVQASVDILIENNKKGYDRLFERGRGAKFLLESSHKYFEAEEKRQETKLIAQFGNYKIDWRPGKPQEQASAQIQAHARVEIKNAEGQFVPHQGTIAANSDLRIYLQLTNQGKTEVSRVQAITSSDNPFFDDRELAFGKLKPGESKEWFLPVKLSENITSRNDLIRFTIKGEGNKKLGESQLVIETQELPQPTFAYKLSSPQSLKGLKAGDQINLDLTVTNQGPGTSGKVTLLLKNGEGERLFLREGRKFVDALAAGKSGKIQFVFDIKEIPVDQDLDLSLDVIDSTFGLASFNQKLKLKLDGSAKEWSNQPPQIALLNGTKLANQKKYTLKTQIADQGGVKDVLVILNDKKIFYQNYAKDANRSKIVLNLDLELTEEINRLILISRDDQNVDSKKALYIRYLSAK